MVGHQSNYLLDKVEGMESGKCHQQISSHGDHIQVSSRQSPLVWTINLPYGA